MPLNPIMNTILKEMWRLREKIEDPQEVLSISENEYWLKYLALVTDYYDRNAIEWMDIAKDFTYKNWTPTERDNLLNGEDVN